MPAYDSFLEYLILSCDFLILIEHVATKQWTYYERVIQNTVKFSFDSMSKVWQEMQFSQLDKTQFWQTHLTSQIGFSSS